MIFKLVRMLSWGPQEVLGIDRFYVFFSTPALVVVLPRPLERNKLLKITLYGPLNAKILC